MRITLIFSTMKHKVPSFPSDFYCINLETNSVHSCPQTYQRHIDLCMTAENMPRWSSPSSLPGHWAAPSSGAGGTRGTEMIFFKLLLEAAVHRTQQSELGYCTQCIQTQGQFVHCLHPDGCYVITQLLNIRVFLQVVFLFMSSGHRAPSCWAFSSERGRDRVCLQNLISTCTGTDSFITSTCFCQQELLLQAAVVGNPSNTEECRGVSKPCSQGGQEPTGTADTVGVAN